MKPLLMVALIVSASVLGQDGGAETRRHSVDEQVRAAGQKLLASLTDQLSQTERAKERVERASGVIDVLKKRAKEEADRDGKQSNNLQTASTEILKQLYESLSEAYIAATKVRDELRSSYFPEKEKSIVVLKAKLDSYRENDPDRAVWVDVYRDLVEVVENIKQQERRLDQNCARLNAVLADLRNRMNAFATYKQVVLDSTKLLKVLGDLNTALESMAKKLGPDA